MKYPNGACQRSHTMRVYPDIIGNFLLRRSSRAFRNFGKCCRSRRTVRAGRFTANGWRNRSGGTTTIRSAIWDASVRSFSARFGWLWIRAFMRSTGPGNKRSLTCARKPAWLKRKLSLKSNVTSSRPVRRAPTKSACWRFKNRALEHRKNWETNLISANFTMPCSKMASYPSRFSKNKLTITFNGKRPARHKLPNKSTRACVRTVHAAIVVCTFTKSGRAEVTVAFDLISEAFAIQFWYAGPEAVADAIDCTKV